MIGWNAWPITLWPYLLSRNIMPQGDPDPAINDLPSIRVLGRDVRFSTDLLSYTRTFARLASRSVGADGYVGIALFLRKLVSIMGITIEGHSYHRTGIL
jgi:hypothetical protein